MSWTSTCASCGAPRDAADRFCASCGAAGPAGAAPDASQPDVAPVAAPTPPPVATPTPTPTPTPTLPPVAAPTPPPVTAPTPPPVAAPTPPPVTAPTYTAPAPPPSYTAPSPSPVYAGVPAVGYAPQGWSDGSEAFDAKGLFRSLYDFKFTSLIATRVIRFVYALLVILASVFAVITLLVSLGSRSGILIVLTFIFVPISYLINLILLRIFMELIVVFFKIGEDVHAIRAGAAS